MSQIKEILRGQIIGCVRSGLAVDQLTESYLLGSGYYEDPAFQDQVAQVEAKRRQREAEDRQARLEGRLAW